jgi:uncharacterized protein (DUF924 family)
MATAEEVLEFWFGRAARNADELLDKLERWFAGGPDVDEAIRQRFAADVEKALSGDLDDWAHTPRGVLALVLLLDQFPRGIYRDTPRAWAGDERALALAQRAFDSGFERELDWEGRHFLIMPFLHTESVAAKERALELSTRALEECPEVNKQVFAACIEQAHKYREVLRRFGRFPHRNEVLGRASSRDEVAFMRDWAQKAPPRIMRTKPAAG